MPGTEGWYAPVNVVTEALPRYVEQTSQDAALAQALQAEYEAGSGVCPPQAAATAGSDSVELSRTPTAVRHSFHLCQSLTLSLHLQGQEQGHCQEQQKGLSYAPGQEQLV